MSFSSRRRNYLLTPHRRDSLIEWMKAMLMHSFVLDALGTTGADTFSHFELLIEEHRKNPKDSPPSRLQQLVPTVGTFHTQLPLRQAFLAYNNKHNLTKRKHITISFNEIRHILNLAQIMALAGSEAGDDLQITHSIDTSSDFPEKEHNEEYPSAFVGPKLITFDGDQTLYSDGANFESNPRLANYMYLLLKCGVNIAVVTAAGYEYKTEKYEYRLSGLLDYFKKKELKSEDCGRFYLFGGECNYLLRLGSDYRLHPVHETGPGGWLTSTKYMPEAPGNWSKDDITRLLDVAEQTLSSTLSELNMRGRVIRKKRSVGLIPVATMTREALDEAVLRVQHELSNVSQITLPFCAFNGGRDVWVDVGNKRVGVEILQSYAGIDKSETLHIGDQFLNTGNDYAARDVCPCIWITSPDETTYILKKVLALAKVVPGDDEGMSENAKNGSTAVSSQGGVNFSECERRTEAVKKMDVFTGELIVQNK
mmetsp:Transcript_26748/g.39565  ORF Transcript_26748/g.39565 Transcript_26748/m.39565 type:complete len:480 (+) Transcript_26748:163-1602(+)|eukprot:CAMPEP_0194214884 /NCGR_PEP_ID=MMETSP0156-20130528/16287_1 /TAXON_ID=33649 /ORGANISM="Thalassionema nitzschioides, Strain L26-B" /LENGTH=479 /DNA_ID=CAMNT_0038943243 /DNA_START=83 /DNA_END=1522 /DNA_ORIENTATION=+